MASSSYQLESFFNDLEKQLKGRYSDDKINGSFKEFESDFEECYFVFDLTKSEIVRNGEMKNISIHTVATHRKNFCAKSVCSSPEELKIFCKKNGLFNGKNF